MAISENPISTDLEKSIAKEKFKNARKEHRKAKRNLNLNSEIENNTQLFSILSNDPRKLFQKIKENKNVSAGNIQELRVGVKTYQGSSVPDGFFESLSTLKSSNQSVLESSESFQSFSSDFKYVKELCDNGNKQVKLMCLGEA